MRHINLTTGQDSDWVHNGSTVFIFPQSTVGIGVDKTTGKFYVETPEETGIEMCRRAVNGVKK